MLKKSEVGRALEFLPAMMSVRQVSAEALDERLGRPAGFVASILRGDHQLDGPIFDEIVRGLDFDPEVLDRALALSEIPGGHDRRPKDLRDVHEMLRGVGIAVPSEGSQASPASRLDEVLPDVEQLMREAVEKERSRRREPPPDASG